MASEGEEFQKKNYSDFAIKRFKRMRQSVRLKPQDFDGAINERGETEDDCRQNQPVSKRTKSHAR